MKETKTNRILRMLMLLNDRRCTHAELSKKFDMSQRNILRDLAEIESAGFVIERTKEGNKLASDNKKNLAIKTLLHFTEEEISILYETLEQVEGTSPVKERLIRKMNTFYDIKALENLRQSCDLSKMKQMRKSMEDKKQVLLKGYRSSNSGVIKDRRVEVFGFMPDYRIAWCYDCETNSCKQFRLSRIEQVEETEASWRYEEMHREPFTDVFRYSDAAPHCTVELRLTLKAFNTLCEDYPAAVAHVQPDGDTYLLKTEVANYLGVSNYVFSMLEDVEILQPEDFKTHIQERLKNYLASDRI